MANPEQEKEPAQLSHIGLDLTEGVVSLFGTRDDNLVRFRFFLPPGLQQLLSTHPLTEHSVSPLLEANQIELEGRESLVAAAASTTAAASKERSPTVELPGKLQTKPQDGRPDRHGKPTAWARFLARIEGRDNATLLSTSFHGKAREIALTLNQGDHLTAQGYLHLRAVDAPDDRLSTFSVIHLLQYPGKAPRQTSPRLPGSASLLVRLGVPVVMEPRTGSRTIPTYLRPAEAAFTLSRAASSPTEMVTATQRRVQGE